jgi:hypothetical protein
LPAIVQVDDVPVTTAGWEEVGIMGYDVRDIVPILDTPILLRVAVQPLAHAEESSQTTRARFYLSPAEK